MAERIAMVDPRQPRFGQGLTGAGLLTGFFLDWHLVLPVIAAVLAGASLVGPSANLYAWLWKGVRRAVRLGHPLELEEAAPPRFANTVGFVFLSAASVAHYAFGATVVAWILGLIVSGLALLSAATGLCVGCELYVAVRRVVTRGRVARRLTAPAERVRAGA